MLGNIEWSARPSNSSFIQHSENLLDESGATIPGLTVDLRIRQGLYVQDCRYDFSVFQIKGGRRLRVYQINVRPIDKSSHTESNGEIWFGSHHHFGERAERFPSEITLGCDHHEEWFRLFLKNANIDFGGKYIPPQHSGWF